MGEVIPALLTVEEAAALLRIGRTKAYALAREWRVTGGQSGLPVIDLGSVLRVPRAQLEQLVGGTLEPLVTVPSIAAQPVEPAATPVPTSRPPSRRRHVDDQPRLFTS